MPPRLQTRHLVLAAALVASCGGETETNLPPSLEAIADQTGAEGDEVSLQLAATDPEGDALTWAAAGLPDGLTLSQDGRIAGSPTYTASEGSPWAVRVTVSDGALSDTATFTWTIADTNRAPTLVSPGDRRDAEDDPVAVQLEASDPDGDPLRFSADGLPPGLQLDAESGRIEGTLQFEASRQSPYAVALTVSDGDLTHVASFTWTVDFTNRPPVVPAVPDQEHLAFTEVSLTIDADDPDGDTLVYAASGLPPGVAIDPATGLITGELTTAGRYDVVVTVGDGALEASTPFTWVVDERPPGLAWTKEGRDLRGSFQVAEPSLRQDLDDYAVTQTASTPGEDVTRILVGDVTGTGVHHVVWETAGQRVRLAPAADVSDHVDLIGSGFRLWLLHDVTGDGALEIGVDQTSTNHDIRFYTPDAEQVWRYFAAHSGDGAYFPVGAYDGKLWMALQAGYSRYPRAVAQIDLASTRVDWQFDVATHFWGRPPALSIDETRGRIALNSGTPHNGASRTVTLVDGSSITMSDNTLYHQVIDFEGKAHVAQPVENTRRTGAIGHAILFDGNVLGSEGHDPTYYRGDTKAHLLTPDGDVIASVVLGRDEHPGFAFDETHVYFHLPRSGTIRRHALDEALTHDWTATVPGGGQIIGLADLSGDGEQELVVTAGSRLYLIAANTGDVLREIEVGPGLRGGAIADLTANGRYEILVGGRDGVYVLSTR